MQHLKKNFSKAANHKGQIQERDTARVKWGDE